MDNCETYKPLIMGLMDDELSPEETSEIQSHLLRCEKCREEYEELLKTSDSMKNLSFMEPEDKIIQKIWQNPFGRFAKLSSIIMILTGWLVLIGYGAYEFLINGEEALIPKIALTAIVLGFVYLFIYILIERVRVSKVDKYKEVIR